MPSSDGGGHFSRGKRSRGSPQSAISCESAVDGAKRSKTGGRQKTSACRWCRRQWDTPNPLTKHHMPTLPRAKGYGPRCDICKYTFQQLHPGEDANEKEKSLEDDTAHEEWMQEVTEWEDQHNGSGRRLGKSRALPSSVPRGLQMGVVMNSE